VQEKLDVERSTREAAVTTMHTEVRSPWVLRALGSGSQWRAPERRHPTHRPREDELAHSADASRTNLAAAWVCFRGGGPTPQGLNSCVMATRRWGINRLT
jgi:hypothetical protein